MKRQCIYLSFIAILWVTACSGPAKTSSFPESCADVQEATVDETGDRPDNGTYTLYVNGSEDKPWDAYCHNMKKAEPKEYLTVTDTENYSQLSVGPAIVETSFRRLRIDPTTLEVDLTDDTFATTGENLSMATFPDERANMPVGWAQFGDGSEFGGSPAEAKISFSDTAFALATEASETMFYCTVAASGNSSASTISVASDLRSVTLSATNADNSVQTKTVADCTHFGGTDTIAEDFTEGVLPLEYVGP